MIDFNNMWSSLWLKNKELLSLYVFALFFLKNFFPIFVWDTNNFEKVLFAR